MIAVSMADGADSAPLKASLRQLLRERRKLVDPDQGGAEDKSTSSTPWPAPWAC